MKLVKFTSPNELPVWINPDQVTRVQADSAGSMKGARLDLSSGMQVVREAPETVIEMLEE